jgi:4-hydroxythreonine-4-phosphate dehydrogenase
MNSIQPPDLKPRLALTMGDVAGIGPEVLVRALQDPQVWEWTRPLVVGHPEVLRRAVMLLRANLQVCPISAPEAAEFAPGTIPCWNPAGDEAAAVPAGQLDARAGRAAYEYLVAAARAALAGRVDAITTAPLNKAALHLAGLDYPGHTEILADVCGVRDFGMMLYLPFGGPIQSPQGLGVVHVTLHTSIRSVPDLLTTAGVREKIGLIAAFMREMGCSHPRIAVCALNPHAGEAGLFGDEEARIIAPAVAEARLADIEATGPLPADTLLKRAVAGEFDGVVAMYHDQGHIALKLIGFDTAVNVTLGLPLVRTSPSHGTAFDIAWRGAANAAGMIQAIRVAARRCRPVGPRSASP